MISWIIINFLLDHEYDFLRLPMIMISWMYSMSLQLEHEHWTWSHQDFFFVKLIYFCNSQIFRYSLKWPWPQWLLEHEHDLLNNMTIQLEHEHNHSIWSFQVANVIVYKSHGIFFREIDLVLLFTKITLFSWISSLNMNTIS